MLLTSGFSLGGHADGRAPNLAYVAGTPSRVRVIEVHEGKVSKIIPFAGDPQIIMLSNDGRY